MKKLFIIITTLIATTGLIVFTVIRKQDVTRSNSKVETTIIKLNQQANLRQATLEIEGMTCASCATGIEYKLRQKKGVASASVDYDSKSGKIIYDPSKIPKSEIIQAIKPYIATVIEDKPLK